RVERLGRTVVVAPDPLCPERASALLFRGRAGRDKDAAAPVARDLEGDQRRRTEPIQADAAARLDGAAFERAEADHAAAEQRRRARARRRATEPPRRARRDRAAWRGRSLPSPPHPNLLPASGEKGPDRIPSS